MSAFFGMQGPKIGLILILEVVVFHYSRFKLSASLGQLLYILTFYFNNFV